MESSVEEGEEEDELFGSSREATNSSAVISQALSFHSPSKGVKTNPGKRGCEAEEQRAGSDKSTFDLLQIVESILQQRSVPQILQLEEQLEASLLRTRSTKTELIMESWIDFQQQVVKLKEENRAIKEENTTLEEENTAPKEEVAVAKNSINEEGTSSLPEQPKLLDLL